MKKRIMYISVFCILIIGIYLSIRLIFPSYPPPRPDNISEDAQWHGGNDGGYWYELVEKKDERYKIRIYGGWTGKLIFEDVFVLAEECKDLDLTDEEIMDSISYQQAGIRIWLTIKKYEQTCYLIKSYN